MDQLAQDSKTFCKMDRLGKDLQILQINLPPAKYRQHSVLYNSIEVYGVRRIMSYFVQLCSAFGQNVLLETHCAIICVELLHMKHLFLVGIKRVEI